MKILVITNLYPPHEIGGYELRCRDSCEKLRELGHEVHILTSDHFVEERAKETDLQVTRTLKIHGMYGHPWLPIHRLYFQEKQNHETLRRTIDRVNPDLIHIWNMGGLSKSLLHQMEQGNVPCVYDVSDHWIARSLRADVWLSWWNAPGSRSRMYLRKTLSVLGIREKIDRLVPTFSWDQIQFKNIYFCSAFMRDLTASKAWPVGHAEVIHCGIQTSLFSQKTQFSSFQKLLWVGRLSEDKDPITAIESLYFAREQGLEIHLDLYGHGELSFVEKVKAKITELGLSECVFLKSAPAAEMRQLYSQYDALLFTSNWGEPFALTPLEAMASALPVITSLDGGQPELARHGENCLIAEAANPKRYAECILELAASEELRTRIAQVSLKEAREKFDIIPIVRQIEAYLLKTIS